MHNKVIIYQSNLFPLTSCNELYLDSSFLLITLDWYFKCLNLISYFLFDFYRSPVEHTASNRPQRKVAKRPTDTLFIIKPKPGSKCYYSTEITVDYTPYKEYCEQR